MPLPSGRRLLWLLWLPLMMLISTGCSTGRPSSSTGFCEAVVSHAIELSPEERQQVPATTKRKIGALNAAVLAACGDGP